MMKTKVLAVVVALALAGSVPVAFAITQNGTSRNDTMIGTSSADTLRGYGGDDTIVGLAGNDLLYGGTGNDVIIGGSGNDRLYGWSGRNILLGQGGNDYLVVTNSGRETGVGPNLLYGGPGADTLKGTGCDGCGTGFIFFGGPGNDRIEAMDAPELIYGEDGDDTIIASGDTYYTIWGGAGHDNIDVNTDIGSEVMGEDGNDVIVSNEGRLEGGPGDDTLRLRWGGEMTGGPGADHFICDSSDVYVVDYNPEEGDTLEGDCRVNGGGGIPDVECSDVVKGATIWTDKRTYMIGEDVKVAGEFWIGPTNQSELVQFTYSYPSSIEYDSETLDIKPQQYNDCGFTFEYTIENVHEAGIWQVHASYPPIKHKFATEIIPFMVELYSSATNSTN